MPGYVCKPFFDPLTYLPLPARIDGMRDNIIKIIGLDVANEEDLHVVLHSDQFRVVDTGFPCKPFAGGFDFQADGLEAQRRLAFKRSWLGTELVNNAMLCRFRSFLFAPLSNVCEDRAEVFR